jgi:hypothetical protein
VIESKTYYFHSGGPGFIITHNVLKKIYDLLPNLMEHWINLCNIDNGGYLIPASDVTISYYLQQPNIDVKIIKNYFSFLHCNYRGSPCHIHEINISDIISCHNMNINDFYEFTNILNNNNYFIK